MAQITELTPTQEPLNGHFEEPNASEMDSETRNRKAPAKNKGGRPKKGEYRAPEGKQPQFFAQVAAVPSEEWGSRAFMYCYVTEPITNPKTFGESRYLLKSAVPILDLEGLKQDYGSFKGWLSLNRRKSGKDASDQVDTLEFEIYDPKYPPKIPRAAWINDKRNIRWEALLPAVKPEAAPTPAMGLGEAIRVYKDIKEDLRDEMEDNQPSDRTRETIETIKAVKDLFPQPAAPAAAAPAAADPFDLAQKIMAMRSNDPMVLIMNNRLESLDKMLAEAREREFRLQQQLLEKAAAANQPAKSGDFFDRILELAANTEKLDKIKSFLGGFIGGDGPARAPKTGPLDVVRELANSQFGSQLGQVVGILAANLATGGARNGAPAPAPNPTILSGPTPNATAPQGENTDQRVMRIGQSITRPMLYEYFLKDFSGEAWAARMFDLWPEDYLFLRQLGADEIIRRYRGFPPAWAIIQAKEEAFTEFIGEFVAWDPNNQVAEEQDDDVKDLELEAN